MDEKSVSSSNFEDLSADNAPNKKLYKPFGLVSMIFGILSLASYVVSFSMPLAIFYPLVGLIFASFDLKRNKERTKFGKVGYITSSIALVFEILFILFFALMMGLIAFLLITSFGEIITI